MRDTLVGDDRRDMQACSHVAMTISMNDDSKRFLLILFLIKYNIYSRMSLQYVVVKYLIGESSQGSLLFSDWV